MEYNINYFIPRYNKCHNTDRIAPANARNYPNLFHVYKKPKFSFQADFCTELVMGSVSETLRLYNLTFSGW